ncbi:CPBP family intramembrane glutamic endopeptidase [Lachnospiraceae bacterium 62-35]
MDIDAVAQERKTARKTFSRMGLAYFLFLATALVFQAGIVLIVRYTGGRQLFASQNSRIILSMISMYGAGFPLFWLLVRKLPLGYEGNVCEEKWEKEKWGFLPLFISFLISIGVMEVGNLLGNGIMHILNRELGAQAANDVFSLIMESSLLIIILFAVILGPIMEELMFRKILIDRIIRFGELRAVIVSGVLFGLVHGNFYQFFYACGLGMVFAYVYVKTGKLRITIIMHMMINGMSAIIAGSLLKTMEYERFMEMVGIGNMEGAIGVVGEHWISYLLLIVYSLGLMVTAFVGFILFICICVQKKIHFLPPVKKIPGRFTYVPVFLNAGMILFFTICTLEFLL